MAKPDPEQLELKEKAGKKEPAVKKPREKKQVQYEGSRWMSLIILVFTVLVGLALFLTNQH